MPIPSGVNVLLVDDEPANLLALEAVLEPLGANLVRAASGVQAMQKVEQADFAVILMDVRMPGMDGFETARHIRARPHSRVTPIIFVTAADSTEWFVEDAYAIGAVDYLIKPLVPTVLKAKVAFFIELHRSKEELREAERQVREAAVAREEAREERYRTLFNSMDEGFCIIEVIFDAADRPVDYRFIETNPAFSKHTSLVDVIGKTVRELAPGLENRWFETYGRVVRTGEPARFVDEARELGRWFDVHATRLGDASSHKVAILFGDITERKKGEDALRGLADELAESDRRKTEFLATLAHELRNPLAPLSNGLQVMRLSAGRPDMIEKTRAMMERQVNHLVHLVDDLLDVARISAGKVELKKEPVDLRRIVASAVETSQPLIEAAGHDLKVDLPQEPLLLDADLTRMAQVIGNLLNNAARYTPAPGHIGLTARRDGEEVVIEVSDTGVGIDPHAMGEVFEMFTQVGRDMPRTKGGLGIGLSLVRRLVTLHGGSVTASSPGPGQGSTFTVRLPLAASAVAVAGDPALADDLKAASDDGNLRVLVVDDNTDAADTMAALLDMSGHKVRVANDGTQALLAAETFRPNVVFLDIGLPGMNGYEVARAMRKIPAVSDSVLVALTGWGTAEDRHRSSEAGFDHHLTKPADMAAVDSLLANLGSMGGLGSHDSRPAAL